MIRAAILALAGIALAMAAGYPEEIAQWRRQREDRLKAEGGWLSVAGLFWLHEGANPFGAASTNEIVLPDGPARAGVFTLKGGKVTVQAAGGEEKELWPDSLDFAQAGRVKLYVI
ncbi:MAG: DUF1684 domain-containing protein, partial [Acidobacteriota bacterium]|nr:DUF1684 domain-containing protein [Acidobacteriota bacterium]